jgi:hypothetical protein
MEMEYEISVDAPHIDFELDNVPFLDGQHLSETCVLYESPQISNVNEERERIQYSSELH